MLPDQSQGNPQQVDPRLLMQMLMARRAQQGAMPGAAAPQAQGQPPATQAPAQQGIPGAASPQPPAQQPPQNQGSAAPQLSEAKPTPFNGTFGNRQGIISQLVNSAEKRGHDKKVNEAEMYYNQINSFLASGKPDDMQKAHQLLDDPKVRKILKAGLDYVPLEEEVPPEAIGVHQAQQKINQKQSVLGQLKQMLSGGRQQGSAQPRPQGRAIIPGASQQAQQAYELNQAKTATEQAHGAEYEAQARKDAAEAAKAKADEDKARADAEQAKAYADNARSQGKLYDKQAEELGSTNPEKKREMNAHSAEMLAMARYHDAMAKYIKTGKIPASALQNQIKSARGDMVALLKGYISDNKDAARAVSKDTGYLFGPRSGLVQQQQDAAKQAKNMSAAVAWFDGEGTTAVTNGKMTLPEAVRHAYEMAGIEAPLSGMAGSDDEPDRPQGVPEDAEWDPETRTWSLPEGQ